MKKLGKNIAGMYSIEAYACTCGSSCSTSCGCTCAILFGDQVKTYNDGYNKGLATDTAKESRSNNYRK